ncbi:MAG: response regulator transcription factor [Croceitalea sp.]|nr:response regulator transcription factor [Croceitalea sp.]MBT8237230.1 response regulator transcription factor [Croceitalea sp.]NNC34919.1 response regulator transcription factor [Croceitalea sp.]NNL08844.1 response regulator transcription factor [Croceitalea sp.]NNM18159.1 response regulator transcription factor [Croceitalea sp.]
MKRIVVIEDLPIALEGIKLFIANLDEFELVGQYDKAIDFINDIGTIKADIVITDINMPEMDGIEMTRLALNKDPDLKIIALSMHTDRKYLYEMIKAGAMGFVLKQSPETMLENAINEVLQNNYYLPDALLRVSSIEIAELDSNALADIKKSTKLNDVEIEIIHLLSHGYDYDQLANNSKLSKKSVDSAKVQLMKKTGTHNKAELIVWAIKNGVLTL